MVTAESKTENVIAAKKAGVINYIVKPFNAADAQDQDRSGVPRRQRIALSSPSASSRLAMPYLTAAYGACGAHHQPSRHRFGACRRRRRRFSAAGSGRRRSPSSSAWMPAVTNRQSTPNAVRAREIGAQRIADRQHALERRPRGRPRSAACCQRQLVDRPIRLAGVEHLAAHACVEIGDARRRNRPAASPRSTTRSGLAHSMNSLRASIASSRRGNPPASRSRRRRSPEQTT